MLCVIDDPFILPQTSDMNKSSNNPTSLPVLTLFGKHMKSPFILIVRESGFSPASIDISTLFLYFGIGMQW